MLHIKILTGKAKVEQKKLLKEADENYKNRPPGWQEMNVEINRKIAELFNADMVRGRE